MNDNNFVPQGQQQQQAQPQQQQFQQQFQQNVNPQQYQQVQYPRKSMVQIFGDFLPKLVLIFLLIGCVAFAYDLINGIVEASKPYGGSFRIFLNYLVEAIADASKYLFYAAVTMCLNRIANK